ncbi:cobalamin biosynthesis protein [Nocardioides nanhaiensis]|uniref:Cobalamin biosynthesis protein CobD n=1 Tax=Nocardioides nanhaiensis TaxID=1476871 RepID=A0ABP8WFJ2_9ACTN
MSRAAGLLLGALLDRVVPDPRRGHPVALFGSLAQALERRAHASSRLRGAAAVGLLVGGAGLIGVVGERCSRGRPLLGTMVTAGATWVVLGGASLEREARAVAELLEGDDLPGARQRLTHLVGRTTSELSEGEVSRAVLESLAENTSDAVVAPLVWGAVAGVPGLLAYRAANTLDAMWGHRSARYEQFGWAAARLDDVLNLPGSRLTALLAVGLGPDHRGAWQAWRRDAPGHPSPNAGPVEAAFAGALGVRLGGVTVYGSRVEHRPLLGSGRAPAVADVRQMVALARRVDVGAVLLSAAVDLARAPRRGAPNL